MNVASEITPYLMLGSAGVRTPGFLKKNNITLVINAAHNFALTASCTVQQVLVDCDDTPDYPLKNHFESIGSQVYAEKERGGKIYVHCVAGISRAPSLVIAYLMRYENMTLLEAYELVHRERLFVRPNVGFWEQLVLYEKELNGKNTITMIPCGSEMIPSVYQTQYENMVM